MSEFDDLQKLIRLKRYEQPPDGYYEQFAESFKERQRSELLRQSARGLLVERVTTWMWSSGTRRWLPFGGATSVLLAAGFYFGPEWFESSPAPEAAPGSGPVVAENPLPAAEIPGNDEEKRPREAPR